MVQDLPYDAHTAVGLVGCTNTFFPLASDQLFETQLRASCSYAFNCCEPVERGSFGFSNSPDEATCVEEGLETGGQLSLLGQRAKAAIDAGKATYDGELAERCMRPFLDAVQQCDPNLQRIDSTAECAFGFNRAFAVGTVKDGEDCTDSIECADEGTCVVEDEDNTITVAGTCKAAAGEGDDCSERNCKAGLECSFEVDAVKCTKVVLLDDGEPCFDGSECTSGACIEGEASGSCFDSGVACETSADCDVDSGDFRDFGDGTVCGDAATVESDICNGLE
jgi:hypothetical protein